MQRYLQIGCFGKLFFMFCSSVFRNDTIVVAVIWLIVSALLFTAGGIDYG